MILQEKVKSGYDIEILFRKKIFQNLVENMYEAHEIPHQIKRTKEGEEEYIDIYYQDVNFCRADYADPGERETGEKSDIVIHLKLKGILYPQEVGICCKAIVEPYIHDEKPKGLMLGMKYIGLAVTDGANGWLILNRAAVDLIDPTLHDTLSNAINHKYHSEVLPGEVQTINIKLFYADKANESDRIAGEIFGIYVNLLLKQKLFPEEEIYYDAARGNIENAEVFIPEDYDYGIAFNPKLLEMTGKHLKNDLFGRIILVDEKPVESFVFSDDEDIRLICKSIQLKAGVNALFSAILGNELKEDKDFLSMTLRFSAKVKDLDLKAAVSAPFYIYPKIKEDNLELIFEMGTIDVDVSFIEALRSALSGKSGLSIALLCLGPIGWIIMPVIYWAIANAYGNMKGELYTLVAKSKVSAANKRIANMLGFLNNKLTFFTKRMSPFYYTHYQAEVKWKDIAMNEMGICAGGVFETNQTFEPKLQKVGNQEELVICDKKREADGTISGLIYRISDYETVFNHESISRPDPAKPNEFLIVNEAFEGMITANQLMLQVQLTPEAIDVVNNKIKAVRFHSGLILSPNEAGYYAFVHRSLLVPGYDLIMKGHKLEFYYRAKRDRREDNNLRSLPKEDLQL